MKYKIYKKGDKFIIKKRFLYFFWTTVQRFWCCIDGMAGYEDATFDSVEEAKEYIDGVLEPDEMELVTEI